MIRAGRRSITYGDSLSGISARSAARRDNIGIGRSGSGVSLGIADCSDVSYEMVVRSMLRRMMAKSSNSKCVFDGKDARHE